ncbi:MAG TPA: NAD-dependent epimerase/dehydratase family protein [Mycobacteriales bacterium]|jgi:nucleoside-diphosphate-sugar epimerase|nr:NAD-dependent epimerase/dehydratase family protein [Mycobacteriales bacterium]
MSTIAVTGATGQVGRRFLPRLLQWAEPTESIRVLVRDEDRGAPFAQLGAEVTVGDLRDADARRRALSGADVVINVAAAFRGVPDNEAYAVNRDAAIALGREAADAGVTRFIQTSTNLVYAPVSGRPTREDDSLGPAERWGAYARSKAEAEAGLRRLRDDAGLPLIIVRLAYVYGEGDPHLAQALRWAGLWAPHQRLQLVHHADVAQALLRALRAPGVEGRTYNAADDAPITAFDLHRLAGVEQPVGAADRTVDNPWDGIVDTARIRSELGFRPLYPSAWTARDAGVL